MGNEFFGGGKADEIQSSHFTTDLLLHKVQLESRLLARRPFLRIKWKFVKEPFELLAPKKVAGEENGCAYLWLFSSRAWLEQREARGAAESRQSKFPSDGRRHFLSQRPVGAWRGPRPVRRTSRPPWKHADAGRGKHARFHPTRALLLLTKAF